MKDAGNDQPLRGVRAIVEGRVSTTDDQGRVSAPRMEDQRGQGLIVRCDGFLDEEVDTSRGDAWVVSLLPDIWTAGIELVPTGFVEDVTLRVTPSLLDPSVLVAGLGAYPQSMADRYRARAASIWESGRTASALRADGPAPLAVEVPVPGEYRVVATWRDVVVGETAYVNAASQKVARVTLEIEPPALLELHAVHDGRPVPGAGFSARSLDWSWIWAGIADQEGRVSLGARPDDELVVRWHDSPEVTSGVDTRVRVGGSGSESSRIVESGATPKVALLEVRGRVHDEVSGLPIAGVKVLGIESAVTDAEGRFVVTVWPEHIPRQSPFLLVRASGYWAHEVSRPEDGDLDIAVRPVFGDDAFLDLTLEGLEDPADPFRIDLVAECLGRDRSKVVIDDDELRELGVGSEGGRLGFCVIGEDRVEYTIRVWVRERLAGVVSGQLSRGGVVARRLLPRSTRRIEGRVVGDAAALVPRVLALFRSGVGLDVFGGTDDVAGGRFAISGLPSGDLYLTVSAPMHGAFEWMGSDMGEDALAVELRLSPLRVVALPISQELDEPAEMEPIDQWPWTFFGSGRGVVGPDGSAFPVLVRTASGWRLRDAEPGTRRIR